MSGQKFTSITTCQIYVCYNYYKPNIMSTCFSAFISGPETVFSDSKQELVIKTVGLENWNTIKDMEGRLLFY